MPTLSHCHSLRLSTAAFAWCGGFAWASSGYLPRQDDAVVESGQLAIVSLALRLLGWLSDSRYFRPILVPTASWLVAALGLFWLIERSASAVGSGA